MIVYYGIVAYVFVVGLLGKTIVVNSNAEIKPKYDNKINLFFAILMMVLPVISIAYGFSNGDKYAYWIHFDNVTTDNSFSAFCSDAFENNKGPIWEIYQYIIKKFISTDYNTFFLITCALQAIAIIRFFYRNSVDYSNSIMLMFLSMSFYYMMNGIRQFTAVCLILCFSDWIINKKYVKILLVVIIAYYIHVSAVVWLPFIFIVHGKPFNRKMLLATIFVVIVIFFLDTFTNLLGGALEETNYAGYGDRMSEQEGGNIVHAFISIIPVLFSYLCKNKIKSLDDKLLNIAVNCSTVAFLFDILSSFTSGILIGRMSIYFSLFTFVLYPHLFYRVFDANKSKLVKMLCFVGYFLYFSYYLFSQDIIYINYI